MSLLVDLTHEVERALSGVPDAKRLQVPEDLADREGRLGDSPATMRSHAWSLPGVPWFRIACLDAGNRARVFSALALPDPSRRLPMFGAEVVEIRNQVTVIAFDWMPVGEDSIDEPALAAIRGQVNDFPPADDLPEWAAVSFSPYALYSRPQTAIEPRRIQHALRYYVRGYVDACSTAPERTHPDAAARAIEHYCHEHFQHDPGGRMLNTIFGKPWVERYATNFLFRLDQRKPGHSGIPSRFGTLNTR